MEVVFKYLLLLAFLKNTKYIVLLIKCSGRWASKNISNFVTLCCLVLVCYFIDHKCGKTLHCAILVLYSFQLFLTWILNNVASCSDTVSPYWCNSWLQPFRYLYLKSVWIFMSLVILSLSISWCGSLRYQTSTCFPLVKLTLLSFIYTEFLSE